MNDNLHYDPEREAEAMRLNALGLRLVPLHGKIALLRNWPDARLGEREIRSWSACGVNWGIITGAPLVVLDTDSAEAEAWIEAMDIETPVRVRTGRGGFHRYFQCPPNTQIHSRSAVHRIPGLDLKGWRSYVVAAGSTHRVTGRRYEYVAGHELKSLSAIPFFKPEWVREEATPPPVPNSSTPTYSSAIRDLRRYIRAIPSIQGQGGDRGAFAVAGLLAEAGLSVEQIMAELQAWNHECATPPWSHHDLVSKARSAHERVAGKNCCSSASPS